MTELSRKIHPTYNQYSEAYPCIIGLGTSGLCDVFLSANKYCRCQQCSKYGTINASVDGAIHFCGLLMRSPIGAPICSLAKWNSQVGGTPMRGGEKLLINYLPACICCATKYVRHVIQYRGANKGLHVLLSRTQAGPGRTVKQEQEEISHNHAQTFICLSVHQVLKIQ